MKIGDLVLTPESIRNQYGYYDKWWWIGKSGIIVREAIPVKGTSGAWKKCWHVLIGNQIANLREESLELVG